jgi:glycosyltransferase involved in cell wall biosynthesis
MSYPRREILSEHPCKMGFPSSQIALPRVSVIVTCYNYARYVGHALNSVATQTFKNFDCVVVDDASTDDSATVIERWIDERKDARFRLIRNTTNSGQTTSFAVGLAATNGEFVAFLDADDFWFPEFLHRHVEAHLNRSFSASLSCSDLVQVDDEQRILAGTWSGPQFEQLVRHSVTTIDADHSMRIDPGTGSLEFFESPNVRYIRSGYLDYPWTATSAMMFRRSALDLVMPKGANDLRINTDCYAFVICHYFTGSFALASALGAYRRHGYNNFANNSVVGINLPCAAPTAQWHSERKIVQAMLHHLLDHYDRFVLAFSDASVRTFVRILFRKSLRYNIAIEDPRLHSVLGTRWMLEDRVNVKASFLLRTCRQKTAALFAWLVRHG